MIYDSLGCPRDQGASDYQDSSRLAGVMATFGYKPGPPVEKYVTVEGPGKFKYRRHPVEYKYTFSRDQTICLFAGLYTLRFKDLIDPEYKTEGDLVSPSVRGHFRRCAGLKATWFQDLWLKAEIIWSAKMNPLAEPNQLLCMLMVADVKYLRMWTDLNRNWVQSVFDYWTGWRGEHSLAAQIVTAVEERLLTDKKIVTMNT